MADSREQVAALNSAIRDRLVDAGAIDGVRVVVNATGARLGVGDRVATRRNDWKLGVANRQTWTITHVDGDATVTVRNERGQVRDLPSWYVDGWVELAYATTVYGAQGETTASGPMVIGESTSGAEVREPARFRVVAVGYSRTLTARPWRSGDRILTPHQAILPRTTGESPGRGMTCTIAPPVLLARGPPVQRSQLACGRNLVPPPLNAGFMTTPLVSPSERFLTFGGGPATRRLTSANACARPIARPPRGQDGRTSGRATVGALPEESGTNDVHWPPPAALEDPEHPSRTTTRRTQ